MSDLITKLDAGIASRRRCYSVNPTNVGSVGLIDQHGGLSEIREIPMGSVFVQPTIDWSPVFVPIATYASFPLRQGQEGASQQEPARLTEGESPPTFSEISAPRYVGVFPAESTSEPEKPEWWAPVTARVKEIASLRAGWDTYGADPVDRRNIVAALNFLLQSVGRRAPVPGIVPLPDGGLQLEWHRGGMDVEVEFYEGEDQGLYFRDAQSGEWEGPSQAGFEEFEIAQRLIGA
ncbi:MAG: hypothetical protein WKF41_19040 [Gaiellaceae bacterium]